MVDNFEVFVNEKINFYRVHSFIGRGGVGWKFPIDRLTPCSVKYHSNDPDAFFLSFLISSSTF